MNGSKVLIILPFHKCAKQNKNWYPIKVLYQNIDLLTTNIAYPITILNTTIQILLKRSSSYQKVLRIPYLNSRKVQQNSIMEIRRSLLMLMPCVFSMFPSILTFDFDFILGSFWYFGALMGLFLGVKIGLKTCIGVYSFSWTTFIFYDSLSSDIWIWLKFGVIFVLWGPNGLVWGSEQSWTNVLRSAHGIEQLSFSMFPSIMTFNLI